LLLVVLPVLVVVVLLPLLLFLLLLLLLLCSRAQPRHLFTYLRMHARTHPLTLLLAYSHNIAGHRKRDDIKTQVQQL